MSYRRIRVITSHVGHARYLADTEEQIVGFIPTPREIKSPYSYSASTAVMRHATDGLIFIKETSHKRYEVFSVPAEEHELLTDDEATDLYVKGYQPE